jgi:hypothetical protein
LNPKVKHEWLLGLVLAACVLVFAAIEYGPAAWTWLASSEDLGTRLRRECATVVREAHPSRTTSDAERESYVRRCITERAKSAK